MVGLVVSTTFPPHKAKFVPAASKKPTAIGTTPFMLKSNRRFFMERKPEPRNLGQVERVIISSTQENFSQAGVCVYKDRNSLGLGLLASNSLSCAFVYGMFHNLPYVLQINSIKYTVKGLGYLI